MRGAPLVKSPVAEEVESAFRLAILRFLFWLVLILVLDISAVGCRRSEQ